MNAAAAAPMFAPRDATSRRPVARASGTALRTWVPTTIALRPVSLPRGSVLRVRDGPGTVVHVRWGLVWITEEHSRRDIVLGRGEAHRIGADGLTVVHADREARVVLELAAGHAPAVEVAAGYGEPGRAVGMPATWRERARSFVRRAADVLEAMRARITLPAHWREPTFERLADTHSPEAVRDRLLRSWPYPYH